MGSIPQKNINEHASCVLEALWVIKPLAVSVNQYDKMTKTFYEHVAISNGNFDSSISYLWDTATDSSKIRRFPATWFDLVIVDNIYREWESIES